MKQYKVLKEMINAPVGTILAENNNGHLFNDNFIVINCDDIEYGIAQKFIEPYTPEPKRWRAKNGRIFYLVDDYNDVVRVHNSHIGYPNDMYNIGNCFKSQATAELVAKAKKLFFELLHDTESTYMNFIKLEKAIKEAKKAVLEDDSNE